MTEPRAAPTRRTKIELLVRNAEDNSFEVREIPSALAYVQSRPQRVAAEGWELAPVESRVAGQQNFILKNTHTDRFLVLSAAEQRFGVLVESTTAGAPIVVERAMYWDTPEGVWEAGTGAVATPLP